MSYSWEAELQLGGCCGQRTRAFECLWRLALRNAHLAPYRGPCLTQVANLARTLIARWKAVAASHAAATAAAAAGSANGGAAQDGRKPVDGGVKAQRAGSATPSGGAAAAAAAAAAPAIDEGLRTRARAMLTDALKAHATAAAAAAAAKAAKARARDGAAAAPLAPPLLPVESERLAEAARALEDAVFGVHGREGRCRVGSRSSRLGVSVHQLTPWCPPDACRDCCLAPHSSRPLLHWVRLSLGWNLQAPYDHSFSFLCL